MLWIAISNPFTLALASADPLWDPNQRAGTRFLRPVRDVAAMDFGAAKFMAIYELLSLQPEKAQPLNY